jgi:hypothetical protein
MIIVFITDRFIYVYFYKFFVKSHNIYASPKLRNTFCLNLVFAFTLIVAEILQFCVALCLSIVIPSEMK